ncbi:GAF domain-containing sensor histidine kinase [Amycolatopsis marina]|nr:GAF domain-containing protein [Amycolatopsis marina]
MEPTLAARALSAATDITTAALSGDDPGAVLGSVVRRAAELADADLGLVMVRTDDGRVAVEAAHPDVEGLLGLELPADSVAAEVARGGEPVVSEDFTTDPRTAPFVPAELRRYGPFAAAPFGTGGRVLGALTVYRPRGAAPFAEATVDLLAAFAAQAGVVLALAEGANARQRVSLYEERERIARELHDVIVQRLYAAGMQLDRVRRRMRKRFATADEARLGEAIDQLDETIEEIRGTVRALRSPEPEQQPQPAAATDLAESARGEVRIAGELLGFPPTLELSGELADIPAERADHIRAALREALSNVVRHSGASETRVTLHRDAQEVRLRVRDNGCGVPQDVAKRGLQHLAERATGAGGKFFVNSSPSLGTLVAFDVPLAKPRPAAAAGSGSPGQ